MEEAGAEQDGIGISGVTRLREMESVTTQRPKRILKPVQFSLLTITKNSDALVILGSQD
jgi:hypothetical protein